MTSRGRGTARKNAHAELGPAVSECALVIHISNRLYFGHLPWPFTSVRVAAASGS